MPDGDDGDGRLGLLLSSAGRVLSGSFRPKLLIVGGQCQVLRGKLSRQCQR